MYILKVNSTSIVKQRSKITGSGDDSFSRKLYSQLIRSHHQNDYENPRLTELPSLWYKIHVFVYDLRNFREKVDSQARLYRIADTSYIGMSYFQHAEAEILKTRTVDGNKSLEQVIREVLRERLERRMKRQAESEDYRVCAAHDLAPILRKRSGSGRRS
jgi:hypothetical protein